MKKKHTKAGTSKVEAAQRRALFVEAMCDPKIKGNATKAAKAAGYSPKTARQQGARLLSDVSLSKAIAERRAEVIEAAQKETGLTTAGVLRELKAIVHSDLRKCFNPETGALLPPHLWPDEIAPYMSSVKVVEMAGGAAIGEEEGVVHVPMYTKEVKLWDKNAAIEKAMKHLGMFERDNEQQPALKLPPGTKAVVLDFSKVKERVKATARRAA